MIYWLFVFFLLGAVAERVGTNHLHNRAAETGRPCPVCHRMIGERRP